MGQKLKSSEGGVMKYRILEKNGKYRIEYKREWERFYSYIRKRRDNYKTLFFCILEFDTLKEAEKFVEKHKLKMNDRVGDWQVVKVL